MTLTEYEMGYADGLAARSALPADVVAAIQNGVIGDDTIALIARLDRRLRGDPDTCSPRAPKRRSRSCARLRVIRGGKA